MPKQSRHLTLIDFNAISQIKALHRLKQVISGPVGQGNSCTHETEKNPRNRNHLLKNIVLSLKADFIIIIGFFDLSDNGSHLSEK